MFMTSLSSQAARDLLASFDQRFSQPKILPYYCEWALLLKLKDRKYMLNDISSMVHLYPSVYKAYLPIVNLINLPHEKLFPEQLQIWINNASKLCIEFLIDRSKSKIDALIEHIEAGGYYEGCTPNYYKLCVQAFKKIGEVCAAYPFSSKEIDELLNHAAYLMADGGCSAAEHLEKILKFQVDLLNKNAIKIRYLVTEMEGKNLEFKSSFEYDVEKGICNTELRYECSKTIAAFLNAEGGTLLVGVNNSGVILGLAKDLENSNNDHDKFILKFKDFIFSRLSKDIIGLVDWSIEEVYANLFVLMVTVKRSHFTVWDGRKFFIRTNPSSEKLLNRNSYEKYVARRFNEKFISPYLGE